MLVFDISARIHTTVRTKYVWSPLLRRLFFHFFAFRNTCSGGLRGRLLFQFYRVTAELFHIEWRRRRLKWLKNRSKTLGFLISGLTRVKRSYFQTAISILHLTDAVFILLQKSNTLVERRARFVRAGDRLENAVSTRHSLIFADPAIKQSQVFAGFSFVIWGWSVGTPLTFSTLERCVSTLMR